MLFAPTNVPNVGWKYAKTLGAMLLCGFAYTGYFVHTVGGSEALILGLVGTGMAAGLGALCDLLYFLPWGAVWRFLLPGVLQGIITWANYGDGNDTDLRFFGSFAVLNLLMGVILFIGFVRAQQQN